MSHRCIFHNTINTDDIDKVREYISLVEKSIEENNHFVNKGGCIAEIKHGYTEINIEFSSIEPLFSFRFIPEFGGV